MLFLGSGARWISSWPVYEGGEGLEMVKRALFEEGEGRVYAVRGL